MGYDGGELDRSTRKSISHDDLRIRHNGGLWRDRRKPWVPAQNRQVGRFGGPISRLEPVPETFGTGDIRRWHCNGTGLALLRLADRDRGHTAIHDAVATPARLLVDGCS